MHKPQILAFLAITNVILIAYSPAGAFSQTEDKSKPDQSASVPDKLLTKAVIALQNNDYAQAISLLRKAITSNDGDAGANYDPLDFPIFEKDALNHGQLQLQSMLRDRPLMGAFLNPTDDIQTWAALKFAEDVLGSRIDWDPENPKSLLLSAEHIPPYNGEPGRIFVRDISLQSKPGDSRERSEKAEIFEQLWSAAVFELHNIKNAREFFEIETKAINGDLDQDTFVKSMFLGEFKTTQLTRKWYVQIYLPHAKKYNLPTKPVVWYCSMWGSPDSIFARYTDKKSYPWEPYTTYYQKLISGVRNSPRADTK
jgi:hypothetical protein